MSAFWYDVDMFRTRDFVLLFSAIMFLVSAIGTTLVTQSWSAPKKDSLQVPVALEEVEYSASTAAPAAIPRAERIAQMRAKIASQAVISAPAEETLSEEGGLDTEGSDENNQPADGGSVVQCDNYSPYAGFWDARDLTLVVAEGSRVLIRGEVSSTSVPETVLQLPVRATPTGNPYCLSSNVIAVANDGSLIRNDELALYGIFSSDTLLGHTLDGFPLYGAGVSEVDSCGGRIVEGGYRYELQSDSETIINCFAAAPVSLP